MLFEYKAFNSENKKITASIEADGVKDARRILREQGLQVLDIKEIEAKAKSALFQSKLTTTDIVSFSRQLASLVSASVPIDESLKTIMADTDNKKLNKTVASIHSSVIGGTSLNQALDDTGMFDDYFVASIKSGEKGSNLSKVLETLSTEVEKNHKFKKKISSALVYPATVLSVVIIIISGLLTFVVPQITSVFMQNGQELPPLTIAIINISDFMVNNRSTLLIGTLATIFGIMMLLKQEKTRFLWHKVMIKLPLIGRLSIVANAVRFARTLALLHDSGTPLNEALAYGSATVKLLPMKYKIQTATQKVIEGASVYQALKSQNALPGIMMYMIASGEKSSNLSAMLSKAADSGEYDLDNSTQKIINSFMPMMVLFMGVIVMLIVLSILLPIFEMNNAVL
jgi:general secretion pathway protein F